MRLVEKLRALAREARSTRNPMQRGMQHGVLDCGVVLSPKQARALELLAKGRTPSEVGAELGVDRTTVWRWQKEPAFAAALAETQTRRRSEASALLEALAVDAIALLGQVMHDSKQPAGLRIRAATAILARCDSTRVELHSIQSRPDAFPHLSTQELAEIAERELAEGQALRRS